MRKLLARSLQLVAKRIGTLIAHALPAPGSRLQAQKGFTLLIAALTASVVLMLGSSIFSIAQKQVTLSSIGRDSQFAFYAADTGAECALYYDIRFQAFATSTESTAHAPSVICDKDTSGSDLASPVTPVRTPTAATSSFSMNIFTRDIATGEPQTGNCVQVTVAKNPSAPYTVIHADGYSVVCEEINTSSRSLQRSVELRY